ncbi:hypothetical protein NW065_03420 [Mycoplasmopsis cynos]|nr:hypothetical protein [Mycoplasmopsis cynos]UWV81050.1 hypothetical protein NW065_03420 [Mycoplasmopsis cynos]
MNIINIHPTREIIHGKPLEFNHRLVCVHLLGLEPYSKNLATLYAPNELTEWYIKTNTINITDMTPPNK